MRIALRLAYDGTLYHGWQNQGQLPTIQAHVERALTQVAAHPVRVICAGRTDKGVHALGQVLHFDSMVIRPARAWVYGSNRYLPADIRVLWASTVADDFHARFSAKARYYRYIILNDRIDSPLMRHRVGRYYLPLDEQRMQCAADYLLGDHDFSTFRAAGCQAKSPIRTVTQVIVRRMACWITIDIVANAFLHRMVRNIVGMLVSIGTGEQVPHWAREILVARDHSRLTRVAPASGLYLYDVRYPEAVDIGHTPANFSLFLP